MQEPAAGATVVVVEPVLVLGITRATVGDIGQAVPVVVEVGTAVVVLEPVLVFGLLGAVVLVVDDPVPVVVGRFLSDHPDKTESQFQVVEAVVVTWRIPFPRDEALGGSGFVAHQVTQVKVQSQAGDDGDPKPHGGVPLEIDLVPLGLRQAVTRFIRDETSGQVVEHPEVLETDANLDIREQRPDSHEVEGAVDPRVGQEGVPTGGTASVLQGVSRRNETPSDLQPEVGVEVDPDTQTEDRGVTEVLLVLEEEVAAAIGLHPQAGGRHPPQFGGVRGRREHEGKAEAGSQGRRHGAPTGGRQGRTGGGGSRGAEEDQVDGAPAATSRRRGPSGTLASVKHQDALTAGRLQSSLGLVTSVRAKGRGIVILAGPSSCGKGAVAVALRRVLHLPRENHVSMGDALRVVVERSELEPAFRASTGERFGISAERSIFDPEWNPPALVQKARLYETELKERFGPNPTQIDWLAYCVLCGLLVPDPWSERIIEGDIAQRAAQFESVILLDGYPRTEIAARHVLALSQRFEIPIIKVVHMSVSKREMHKRALGRLRQDDTPEMLERRYTFYVDHVQPAVELMKAHLGSQAVSLIDAQQPVYLADGSLDLEASVRNVAWSVLMALGVSRHILENLEEVRLTGSEADDPREGVGLGSGRFQVEAVGRPTNPGQGPGARA